ncbi:endonuclease/exonuclease/phosphatase family protein [Evansella tamaricis]|uniref:Endonuclease/exonuclease/phosphatase family protein n=1 Tax=Evansella tamaricis TaxID=2069301 RepID=A0ABS6JGF2_9BACI|nr:endonuclease/exonuclease/phosphatase family protein [Evansella tamaricis]MBU9712608.1 endonuclease/exonuclease/phosphatase family protein [Evansella tamaricis]
MIHPIFASKKLILFFHLLILLTLPFYFIHGELGHKYSFDTASTTNLPHDLQITVTTYNIHFGKGQDGKVDIHQTIATLKELDADIISLQEVERFSLRSGFVDQVKLMAELLEMNAVFSPSLAFPGLYYGNAILSKYPIKNMEVLSFDNRIENRTALFSEVEITEGKRINIINTHLGLDYGERRKAIDKINEKLLEINGPLLLMGDLNATPSQREYESWNDIITKSNKGKPLRTFYKHDWQIDYIFHTSHFTVEDISVYESDSSDHYPLTGVFRLYDGKQ